MKQSKCYQFCIVRWITQWNLPMGSADLHVPFTLHSAHLTSAFVKDTDTFALVHCVTKQISTLHCVVCGAGTSCCVLRVVRRRWYQNFSQNLNIIFTQRDILTAPVPRTATPQKQISTYFKLPSCVFKHQRHAKELRLARVWSLHRPISLPSGASARHGSQIPLSWSL